MKINIIFLASLIIISKSPLNGMQKKDHQPAYQDPNSTPSDQASSSQTKTSISRHDPYSQTGITYLPKPSQTPQPVPQTQAPKTLQMNLYIGTLGAQQHTFIIINFTIYYISPNWQIIPYGPVKRFNQYKIYGTDAYGQELELTPTNQRIIVQILPVQPNVT